MADTLRYPPYERLISSMSEIYRCGHIRRAPTLEVAVAVIPFDAADKATVKF